MAVIVAQMPSTARQPGDSRGEGRAAFKVLRLRCTFMIPAIVLAAGLSTRMGRLKATLPLGSGTFLSRIIETLRSAGVDDVVVVVGHRADDVMASVARMDIAARFAMNPDYESGQFSSLVAGLDAVDAPGVSATLVTLVDVPLVTVATVRAVVDQYHRTHAPIVRPTRGTEHGHPVLIDRRVFGALRRADPSGGVKPVVRAYASPAGDFPVDDEGAFRDIDTVDEYQRALAEWSL